MDYLQVLVELIQDKAHTVHQAAHIGWLALRISRARMSRQCRLEFFKIIHPLQGKIMFLDISFVEYQDERKLCFVKDGTSVKHVRHKSSGCGCSRSIDDICDDSRERRGYSVGDNSPRGGPGEYFDLSRSVKNHIAR